MKRLTFFLTLLSLATVAYAAPTRDDDFDFAQGLLERKYYDLAKEQFQKIISDAATTEQKANGELGLAYLLKAQASDMQAETNREPKDVLAIFKDAEDKFDAFLTTYPNHPKKVDAEFEVGNLLRMKGSYLGRQIESKPDKAEEYRGMADKAYGNAIDLFREVTERLQGRSDDKEAKWNAQKARYFQAATTYERAILFPEASSERRTMLETACKLLDSFIWDNEDNILGGYAYVSYGLAKTKLNEPADALEYFETAASNYPVPDRGQEPGEYLKWTDLFMYSYYQIGLYCNELGKQGDTDYREIAVKQFEHMLDRVKDAWDRKTGHLALLEYAKALSGLKEYKKALEVCSKVSAKGEELTSSTDWGSATSFLANKLLPQILAEAAANDVEMKLPPEEAMRAAMGKKLSRDWDSAIRAFQQVIKSAQGTDQEKEYAPKAWMNIGECYLRDDQYVEALFAYDWITKKWPDLDVAGDAAYYGYRAASALASTTKDPRDEDLKKQKRSEFATKYKDNPRSVDLQYYEAADIITDADTKRFAGNLAAAKKGYEQAIPQLEQVKSSSILYAKAMARIGEVEYQLGEPQKALAQFAEVRKYIRAPKNTTTDDDRIANRNQALALCAFFSARCHAKLSNWPAVVDDLKDFEETYSDDNVKNFHAPAKFERARALLNLEKLDAAEKQALDLRDQFPDNGYTPFIFQLLGKKFQDEAAAAREAKDMVAWRNFLSKAAEYYGYFLDKKDNPGWEDWQTIGYWYKDLGDSAKDSKEQDARYGKAELYLGRAANALAPMIDKVPARSQQRKDLEKSMDGIDVLLSEVMMKQKHYAEAEKVYVKLLITDPGARDRVMELLQMQEFPKAALDELMNKIRAIPSLMEGLAKVWMEQGGEQAKFLRALTLLRILIVANPDDRYSDKWWGWQLLRCQTFLRYGQAFRDKAAYENVKKLIDDWDNLGVLKRTPYYTDFQSLRTQADLELQRLPK